MRGANDDNMLISRRATPLKHINVTVTPGFRQTAPQTKPFQTAGLVFVTVSSWQASFVQ